MPKSKLTEDEKETIFELREKHGKSFKPIGDLFDVSASTAQKAYKDKKTEKEILNLRDQLAQQPSSSKLATEIVDIMKHEVTKNRNQNIKSIEQ